MPLIVCVVHATGEPSRVSEASVPDAPWIGTIPRRFRAPTPTATLKLSWLPLQARLPNEEPFRPSSHVSICFAETTGTPCACAEATTASEPGCGEESKCMFVVNTP